VSLDYLRHFHRVLKPDGLFVFAGGLPDYVEWTRAHLAAQGGFVLHKRDGDRPPEDWIETRYEAKARAEGRNAVYLEYRCKNV
jgi:tRNA (guanine-N7-)-methyltransferase